jgi:hypothetical protein
MGLQVVIENQRSAYEGRIVSGLCRTVTFFFCTVCQRLNTADVDAVTDALTDWAWSFHHREQRARMRLALLMWIRRCYYAPNYERLMTWLGLIMPPVYDGEGGPRECVVWDDAARRFCSEAPWGVYTLCERHARAILPEFRRKRDRAEAESGALYPQPAVDEWVDVDRSGTDALHVIPNSDAHAQREAKRRRGLIVPAPARPGVEEFRWGPREKGPDHRSFMRPDTGEDDDDDDNDNGGRPWSLFGLPGVVWRRLRSLF